MRRRLLIAAAALLIAVPLFAGSINVTINIGTLPGDRLESKAYAVHYNDQQVEDEGRMEVYQAIINTLGPTFAAFSAPNVGSPWSHSLASDSPHDPPPVCYVGRVTASSLSDNSTDSTGTSDLCFSGPPQCYGCACTPGGCNQSESCPIILDLNGDGIHTTGIDDPVNFWIDLQGRPEMTAWTDPHTEEAFLWLDLNHDGVAQVTELFGSRMRDRDGHYYPNGYEALEDFDRAENGGNDDGQITPGDRVWGKLRLWVDRNHDGVSQRDEISELEAHGIVALNLNYVRGDSRDEHGNELYLAGSYVVRVHDAGRGARTKERLMADIELLFIPNP